MQQEFAGFPCTVLAAPIWKVGPPNSVAHRRDATVKVDGRCVTAGQPYELEGAVAPDDDDAVFAAAVQNTVQACKQLTPAPLNAARFGERRLRVSKIEPVEVPVLDASQSGNRFGMGTPIGPPLAEDPTPFRRAVATIRRLGWEGAILVPGPFQGTCGIVVPRSVIVRGALRIAQTGLVQVPPEVVEHTLGTRLLSTGAAARAGAKLTG